MSGANKTCVYKVVIGKGSKYHGRVGKKTYRFTPGVNILCGPNGSGKSSILQAVFDLTDKRCKGLTFEADSGMINLFDYEKDNPRIRPIESAEALASLFHSHGETNRELNRALRGKRAEGSLVMLDEPEQGIDVGGLVELRQLCLTTNANQLIISTHSPILILCPDFNVIELEKGYKKKVRDIFTRAVR